LFDDRALVRNIEVRITTLGRPLELVGTRQDLFDIDLEAFKASMNRLLVYEKSKFKNIDFVDHARQALRKIGATIDSRIDWLVGLRDFVRASQVPAADSSCAATRLAQIGVAD
jgi:hypothetical protein